MLSLLRVALSCLEDAVTLFGIRVDVQTKQKSVPRSCVLGLWLRIFATGLDFRDNVVLTVEDASPVHHFGKRKSSSYVSNALQIEAEVNAELLQMTERIEQLDDLQSPRMMDPVQQMVLYRNAFEHIINADKSFGPSLQKIKAGYDRLCLETFATKAKDQSGRLHNADCTNRKHLKTIRSASTRRASVWLPGRICFRPPGHGCGVLRFELP